MGSDVILVITVLAPAVLSPFIALIVALVSLAHGTNDAQKARRPDRARGEVTR